MRRVLIAFVLVASSSTAQQGWGALLHATAFLDGPSESPPNASPGTGFADVVFDTDNDMLQVFVQFQDLIGTTMVAHIHARVAPPGIAGVAVPLTGFPVGVTGGNYNNLFDTSVAATFLAGFITANGGTTAGAEAALFDAINAGEAYVNIHTTQFPGGEIRGFLQPQPIPEPSGMILLAGGALLVAGYRRYSRTRLPG